MVGTDEERDPDCIERCTKVHTVDRSFPRYIDVSGFDLYISNRGPDPRNKISSVFFLFEIKKKEKRNTIKRTFYKKKFQ